MRKRPWLALAILVSSLVGSGIDHAPPVENPAVFPQPRTGPWLKQHEDYVNIAARGNINLLFLGDSITHLWGNAAPGIWSRYYAPRKAANFGIGGDCIQQLLWRLDHGELDGIQPQVVVLMIGTNNIPDQTEDQVLEGIKTLVDRIRIKLPDSKLLLLGITPRGLNRSPKQVTTKHDPRIPSMNARLARLEDPPKLRYLDFGPALLDESGRLVQVIQPDFVHLSRKGYQIWADTMEPTLWKMMNDE